jgi:hypothetical protein
VLNASLGDKIFFGCEQGNGDVCDFDLMTKTLNDANMGAWRGRAIPLRLRSQDLDLIDTALCLVPELRITILVGQEVRKRGLTYPIKSVNQLVDVLDGTALNVDGHQIDDETIRKFVSVERFPIQHEGELLGIIHMALMRCRIEAGRLILDKLHLSVRPPADAQQG